MAAYFDGGTAGSTTTVIASTAMIRTVRYVAETTNCTPRFSVERFSVDSWLIAELRESAARHRSRASGRSSGSTASRNTCRRRWRRCMQPPGRFAFYQGAF